MACADAQDQVGIERGYGLIDSPAVQPVLYGNGSEVAERRHHGRAEALGQIGNLLLGAALPDAVAHVDHRSLRLVERPRHLLQVIFGGVARPDVLHAAVDYPRVHLLCAQQPVVHGQMYRPDGGRLRDAYGALDGLRQALRLDDSPVGLGERRRYGRRTEAVVEVQDDAVGEAAGVAREGDHHHGQIALPHVDELTHALGESRAQVHHHRRGIQAHLRVAARHGRHAALVERQNAVNVVAGVQRVEEVRLPRPGVVEDVPYARRGELLDHDLGWVARELSCWHLRFSPGAAQVASRRVGWSV